MKTMKQGRYLLPRETNVHTLHSDIVTITLAEHSDRYRMNRKEGPWIPKGPPLIHSHLDYQSVLHYMEVPTKSKDIKKRWGRSSTKKKHE